MRRETLTIVFTLLAIVGLATAPALADGGTKGDVEVGLFGGLAFPDSYGSFSPDDSTLWGGRFGVWFSDTWSTEISFQEFTADLPTNEQMMLGVDEFKLQGLRLNFLHNFNEGETFRPFVTFGFGEDDTDAGSVYNDDDLSLNLGGGLRWFLSDNFGARWDARMVSTDLEGMGLNETVSHIETTFGLTWALGGSPPADTDGDGVIDRKDKCPNTPQGAQVDATGCPLDSDGDGVWNGLDKCPDTAPGVPVTSDGCDRDTDGDGVHDGDDKCPDTPKGAVIDASGCPKDSDGDGVYDGLDKCPDTPKGATVDSRGCPKDSDNDGVYDGIDKCPNSPRGAVVDASGCPKDSDGDGVFDGLDKCPGTAAGTEVDSRGCKKVFDEDTRTFVLKGVNFETNSDVLTSDATRVLDEVAQTLAQWPEVKIEVAGHTDSQGSDNYNLGLSGRRAESVMKYLGTKGVAASRMTARGYGESQPIADNGTADGRAENRRVELKRLN